MNKTKYMTILLILAAVITVSFIFHNSITVSAVSNKQSKAVADAVQPLMDPGGRIPEKTYDALIRKMAHVFEFSLLGAELMGLTLLAAYTKKRRVTAFLCSPLFGILAIAVTDEFIQSFRDRTDCLKDVLIDFGGGVAALLLVLGIWSIVRLRKRKCA